MKDKITVIEESIYDPAEDRAICSSDTCTGCSKHELVTVHLPAPGNMKLKMCIYRCYAAGFCRVCGHFMKLERWFDLNLGGDGLCAECHGIVKEAYPELYEDDDIIDGNNISTLKE